MPPLASISASWILSATLSAFTAPRSLTSPVLISLATIQPPIRIANTANRLGRNPTS